MSNITKHNPHELSFCGERFLLLPDRACYHPRTSTLLVADLHFGKSSSLQAEGLAVHGGEIERDLRRLEKLFNDHSFKTLFILGDMIHDRHSLNNQAVELIGDWLGRAPYRVTLIEGNHDRHMEQIPQTWQLKTTPEVTLGVINLRHQHRAKPGPAIAGHTHPQVVLKSKYDRLRLPCFTLHDDKLTLPAFGSLTGGCTLAPDPSLCIFVASESRVWPLRPDDVS